MLIAHISDSHIELPEPQGAGRINDFKSVVRHIQQLDTVPDFIIHTGDIAHCNQLAEYETAHQMLSSLKSRLLVIPGNKDRRENLRAVFGAAAGEGTGNAPIQFKVEAGKITLLMLDTLSENSNKGAICEARAEWIEQQLAAISGPVVIFMHHPTYDMPELPSPFQMVSRQMADRFETIIAAHPNVTGIFCGHAHRTTKGVVAGVPAMSLTAMSLDRRKGKYPSAMDGKPIYQLIKFDDNGGFETSLQACD